MTSATSFSAWAVFTWKNDGAAVRKRAPERSSSHRPRPSSTSIFFTLRCAPSSASTRTIEVALSASLSVRATAARGKALGGVQSAISTLWVRRLPRTPTR